MGIGEREGLAVQALVLERGKDGYLDLFTENAGRVRLFVDWRLWRSAQRGYLIEVPALRNRGAGSLLKQPALWVQRHIVGLHVVLGLCQLYLPARQPLPEVWHLMMVFFETSLESEEGIARALLVGLALLNIMGEIPEHILPRLKPWSCLISQAADSMVSTKDTHLDTALLTTLLKECVYAHPYARKFSITILLERFVEYETL